MSVFLIVCISKVTFGLQAQPKTNEIKNICKALPLAAESLDSGGLYVFDDGFRFVIWFGKMLSPNIAMNLLGDDFTTDYSRVCFLYYCYTYSHKSSKLKNQCFVVNKDHYFKKKVKDIVVNVICELFQDILFDVKTEIELFIFLLGLSMHNVSVTFLVSQNYRCKFD